MVPTLPPQLGWRHGLPVDFVRRWAIDALWIAVVLGLEARLDRTPRAASTVTAWACFAALILLAGPKRFHSSGRARVRLAAGAATAACVLVFPLLDSRLRLAFVCACMASIGWMSGDAQAHRRAAHLVVAAALFVSIEWTFDVASPLHLVLSAWARGISLAAGLLGAPESQLGVTASGCTVVMMGSALVFVRNGVGRAALSRNAMTILILLVVQVGYVLVGPTFLRAVGAALPEWRFGMPNMLDAPWILCVLVGGVTAALSLAGSVVVPATSWFSTPRNAIAVGASLLVAGLSLRLVEEPTTDPVGSLRIWIHDNGGSLDRRVPKDGAYGGHNVGMFGNLETFLGSLGAVATRRDLQKETSFEGVDVVVLINLIDRLNPVTEQRLDSFVRGGGGLLILADHTGLQTIREPLNHVVKPYGIDIQFDSAIPLQTGWVDGMRMLRHPITAGVLGESDIQIWTGASLAVESPAYPVILGLNTFSDPGNPQNSRRGNLGNMVYDPGERIGDLVLVAAAEPGEGRVLVFGDTSTFQNAAVGYSWRFANRCLDWLTARRSRSSSSGQSTWQVVAIIGALMAASIPVAPAGWYAVAAVLLLGVFSARTGSAVSGAIGPPRSQGAGANGGPRLAVLDIGAPSRATAMGWQPDAVGGLQVGLMRAGYQTRIRLPSRRVEFEGASLWVFVAPMEDIGDERLSSLSSWVESGGTAVLVVGLPESLKVPRLLRFFGVSVDPTPLGPVETALGEVNVRFHCAYPLRPERDVTVVSSVATSPLIVRRRRGSGTTVAIGDSQFFLNKNLEDNEEYVPENVAGLKRLLESLQPAPEGSSK